jgi:tRNA threonylcarbamoyladenosine biosynthesis protein TsaB
MPTLLLETSGSGGFAALAKADAVLAERALDAGRGQGRDLALAVRELLDAHALAAKNLAAVAVSTGPGSYTGLRVGLASAKALAYAANVPLIAVPTFAAIAVGVPATVTAFDVIADGLQGWVYHQRFENGTVASELTLSRLDGWLATTPAAVLGPGLATLKAKIPAAIARIDSVPHTVTATTLARAAAALAPVTRAELFALEPLYLRGSSAEEKRKASAEVQTQRRSDAVREEPTC